MEKYFIFNHLFPFMTLMFSKSCISTYITDPLELNMIIISSGKMRLLSECVYILFVGVVLMKIYM